jgi:hypothetical protein
MSNGRRMHRDHHLAKSKQAPPDGRLKRMWWRCKKWMGINS